MNYLLPATILIASHLLLVFFGFMRLDRTLRELLKELKK